MFRDGSVEQSTELRKEIKKEGNQQTKAEDTPAVVRNKY
jgi:hypothetical protein